MGGAWTVRARGLSRAFPSALLLVVAIVLALAPGGARGIVRSASGRAPAPLSVSAASLSQSGLDLVWTVQLAKPFSVSALTSGRQSLCLLVGGGRGAHMVGEVCLAVDRRLSLIYRALGPSGTAASTITGTVSQPTPTTILATFLPGGAGIAYGPLRWRVLSGVTGRGCAGVPVTSSACYRVIPAKPRLLVMHTPQLVGCVPSESSEVFAGSPITREIALTFDDGPAATPPSMQFVDLLAREHVPATFFEVGWEIPQYDPTGAIERSMLASGDMIGDHTWSHPEMPTLSASAQRTQLVQTLDAIRTRTGFTPCLWRPPYGAVDSKVIALARSLGLLTIMWNVDPRDWSLPGTSTIYSRVVTAARDGSIVLQHFGGGPRYETLAALPREIATLRARGYQFVTVAQLLGLEPVYR